MVLSACNVFAQARNQAERVLVLLATERAALTKPPGGGALIDAGGVDLIDHQPPGGREQAREVRAGGLERLDMVQGHDRQRGVEMAIHLKQCPAFDMAAVLGDRVDRCDLVASGFEHRGELSIAGADLEHVSGRRGEGGSNKRQQISGEHLPEILAQWLPVRRNQSARRRTP